MKKTIFVLAAALMIGTMTTTAFAESFTETYEENGITISYPETLNQENLKGVLFPAPCGTANGIGAVAYEYYALPLEELQAISEKNEDEWTEEEMMTLLSKKGSLMTVYSFDDGRTVDDALAENDAGAGLDASEFTELGKAGDVTFYAFNDPSETEAYLDNVEPVYAEEFVSLQESLLEALKSAEFFEPENTGEEDIGQQFSFETTDIDGNPVSSSDIFAEHKVTMINVWETGCGPCLSELSELGEINRGLAEKGKDAAVIGICVDADTEKDLCKALLEENNVDYLNILPYDSMFYDLEIRGFPTSYFVDSEGKILAEPVIGVPKDISTYENTIDKLLSGEEPEITEGSGPVTPNEEGIYRVFVKDVNGDPVKDTAVQFCSDEACMVNMTDENGMAGFNMPEGVYTVHILKAPEGYERPDDEYKTQAAFCDISIVMQ